MEWEEDCVEGVPLLSPDISPLIQELVDRPTWVYVALLAEVMKYAYADRSKYLGDPDFFDVPVTELISKEYAKEIKSRINLNEITSSDKILPVKKPRRAVRTPTKRAHQYEPSMETWMVEYRYRKTVSATSPTEMAS